MPSGPAGSSFGSSAGFLRRLPGSPAWFARGCRRASSRPDSAASPAGFLGHLSCSTVPLRLPAVIRRGSAPKPPAPPEISPCRLSAAAEAAPSGKPEQRRESLGRVPRGNGFPGPVVLAAPGRERGWPGLASSLLSARRFKSPRRLGPAPASHPDGGAALLLWPTTAEGSLLSAAPATRCFFVPGISAETCVKKSLEGRKEKRSGI